MLWYRQKETREEPCQNCLPDVMFSLPHLCVTGRLKIVEGNVAQEGCRDMTAPRATGPAGPRKNDLGTRVTGWSENGADSKLTDPLS